MHDYQIKKLDELNFCWNLLERNWDCRYEQCKRYFKLIGSTYISKKADFEGVHLGYWFHTQIKSYKDGKMSDKRIKKMNELNPEIFIYLENDK